MMARRPAAEALAHRVDALGRFVRAVEGHVPDAALADARTLVEQAGARLRLSADHIVVALAGSTGGGKSSLFNALARIELSPVGHLRPTTGQAHACVWSPDGADPLLDWLGVAPALRFGRESALDAEDEAPLRGLVLLDLPDMDSVSTDHRLESERLVSVVDLVIWVLDPQKYADRTVHEEFLRHMGAMRDVTVVILNQVDRLSPADAARCRADLARLVEEDGLHGVPVLATSAMTGDGVGEVRTLLEKTVASRRATMARFEGELDAAVASFEPVVGPAVSHDAVDRDLVTDLANSLIKASGVEAVAVEFSQRYARRAALPGWPFRRARGGVSEIRPAQPAAVGLAVREIADRAAAGLPAPWPEEVRDAASRDLVVLPDELGRAMSEARPRPRRLWGWWFLGAVWWLALAAGVGGAGWLGWYAIEHAKGRPVHVPLAAGIGVPYLMVGAGALMLALLAFVGGSVAAARARRVRAGTQGRLSDAVTSVAREHVVAPVRVVLRDYSDARTALATAAAPTSVSI